MAGARGTLRPFQTPSVSQREIGLGSTCLLASFEVCPLAKINTELMSRDPHQSYSGQRDCQRTTLGLIFVFAPRRRNGSTLKGKCHRNKKKKNVPRCALNLRLTAQSSRCTEATVVARPHRRRMVRCCGHQRCRFGCMHCPRSTPWPFAYLAGASICSCKPWPL